MAKIITETSYDVTLKEDEDKKGVYVSGIFSTAEKVNNNDRQYTFDVLDREVNKVSEQMKQGSLWGELGHPPNPEVNPDRIAIKVESLEWKGKNLHGKAKVLDTPMGSIAQTLVKEGRIGISSRGLGTVSEEGVVNDDYKLLTWDLVTNPSNSPSWVKGIYEAKEWKYVEVDSKIQEEVVEEPKELTLEQIDEQIKALQQKRSLLLEEKGIKNATSILENLRDLDV